MSNIKPKVINRGIPFGVGCYLFGYDQPSRITLSEYGRDIREALEGIPSVATLDVDLEGDTSYEMVGPGVPTRDGPLFVPVSADIQFRVTIPKRLHAKLVPWISWMPYECAEFEVRINAGFYSPVTFVRPLEPLTREHQSISVVLVREFLRGEFSRLNPRLRFGVVGPSPFHADCVLAMATHVRAVSRTGRPHSP